MGFSIKIAYSTILSLNKSTQWSQVDQFLEIERSTLFLPPLGGVMLNFEKISGYSKGKTTISLRQLMWSARPPTFLNVVFRSTSMGETSAQLEPILVRSRKIDFVTSFLSMFIGRSLDNSIIIRLFLRFLKRSSSELVSLELKYNNQTLIRIRERIPTLNYVMRVNYSKKKSFHYAQEAFCS